MRIVFTSDAYWPRINGVVVSMDAFRKELEAMGHSVLLLVPGYPGAEESTDKGIIRMPSKSVFFSAEDSLIQAKKATKIVNEILEDFQPDILHAHTEFSSLKMLLEYQKKTKIPLVMSSHTHWEKYMKNYFTFLPAGLARRFAIMLMKRGFKHAHHIISPTENMHKVLLGYGITKPVTIIPTGISTEDFPLVENREASTGKKVLLFVGRVSKEKNPAFLLDVMERVLPECPDTVLRLVGDGPGRPVLEQSAKKRGIAHAVEFLGYMPRSELPRLYREADIFTFPSKTETQGLVTIESMLSGTPVVAIGEMGTIEVMNGDNGGFMVPDDCEIFSQRVIQLLKDPKLWKEKSAEAVQYAQGWTSPALAKRLLDAYNALL